MNHRCTREELAQRIAMMDQFKTNREAAEHFGVSIHTVKSMMRNYRKKGMPQPTKKYELVYRGEIRCGQYFSGINGFVWDASGETLRMYVMETHDGSDRVQSYNLADIRSHHLQRDNPVGTLLFGKVSQ